MQKKVIFLYLFFFSFTVNHCFSVDSQSNEVVKNTADSLFNIKEYTNAQKLYLELYTIRKVESNDLLLKLALTYEGLGDITSSIFYLKKYNQYNPTMDIEMHIEELANNHNLIGYKITDAEKLKLYLSKYKLTICFSFVGITIIIALLFYYNYFIQKKKTVELLIPLSIFVVISFLSIRMIDKTKSGIINKECLLMNEPSAGAKLQKRIKEGHQVIILEEKDIWYKIELNEEFYFVRKSNVTTI